MEEKGVYGGIRGGAKYGERGWTRGNKEVPHGFGW